MAANDRACAQRHLRFGSFAPVNAAAFATLVVSAVSGRRGADIREIAERPRGNVSRTLHILCTFRGLASHESSVPAKISRFRPLA